jgi:hypothetical protein
VFDRADNHRLFQVHLQRSIRFVIFEMNGDGNFAADQSSDAFHNPFGVMFAVPRAAAWRRTKSLILLPTDFEFIPALIAMSDFLHGSPLPHRLQQ